MRDRVIRYAFVLLVALGISSPCPRPLAVQAPNPTGHYEQASGIPLVCLQGDPYEMGLQQGTLLREPLRELVRDYLYQRIVFERGVSHSWLLAYARLSERDVPSDLQREMHGIADGAGLSYQDVLLLNTVPDLLALTYGLPAWDLSPTFFSSAEQSATILQSTMSRHPSGGAVSRHLSDGAVSRPQDDGTLSCATFAVWGSATTGGGLLVGHNLDSAEADLLGRYLLVVVRQPSQGNAFVSAGLMGMVGVWTGMNEEKLTVTLSSSPSIDVASNGQPLPFVLRQVLEHAGDLTEALHLLLAADRLYGGNVVLGDGKAPEALAVELSAHRHAVFEADAESEPLARTNHFLDPNLELAQRDVLSGQERVASEARLNRLQALLEFNKGWMGAEKGLALLRDERDARFNDGMVYGPYALQSVLFHPERLTLWVAQGQVLRSSAQGQVLRSSTQGQVLRSLPQGGGTTPLESYVNLALTSLPPECPGNR